jgi:hypothetical protein
MGNTFIIKTCQQGRSLTFPAAKARATSAWCFAVAKILVNFGKNIYSAQAIPGHSDKPTATIQFEAEE